MDGLGFDNNNNNNIHMIKFSVMYYSIRSLVRQEDGSILGLIVSKHVQLIAISILHQ